MPAIEPAHGHYQVMLVVDHDIIAPKTISVINIFGKPGKGLCFIGLPHEAIGFIGRGWLAGFTDPFFRNKLLVLPFSFSQNTTLNLN